MSEQNPEQFRTITVKRKYITKTGDERKYEYKYQKQRNDRCKLFKPKEGDELNPKSNRYFEVVSILQNEQLIRNKTYKQITEIVNKKLNTKYNLSSIYSILLSLDPNRKKQTDELNEQLRKYLSIPMNTESLSIEEIRRNFNSKYHYSVSKNKIKNFMRLVDARREMKEQQTKRDNDSKRTDPKETDSKETLVEIKVRNDIPNELELINGKERIEDDSKQIDELLAIL